MDNFTVFDDRNDALLLFYNINSPICILLNLLAIYLILFKSSREMRKYRWYLLNYQQNPEAIELLNIPNIYYVPPSFLCHRFLAIITSICCSSALIVLGLICHIQYIFRKRCEHLTTRTQELQKKFLKAQIIQVTIPIGLLSIPISTNIIHILDGRLGLQILNDIMTMMTSTYGEVATIFLIFFNASYREFLLEKFRELGQLLNFVVKLKHRMHETKVVSQDLRTSETILVMSSTVIK
uniref:G_PROTEIN_RECEP_F1_2 domain-containing protein n=1 Tax=Heterorhabditis bacteriophora TaxID=37862 RepID=A0A1I7WG93_HETBA